MRGTTLRHGALLSRPNPTKEDILSSLLSANTQDGKALAAAIRLESRFTVALPHWTDDVTPCQVCDAVRRLATAAGNRMREAHKARDIEYNLSVEDYIQHLRWRLS